MKKLGQIVTEYRHLKTSRKWPDVPNFLEPYAASRNPWGYGETSEVMLLRFPVELKVKTIEWNEKYFWEPAIHAPTRFIIDAIAINNHGVWEIDPNSDGERAVNCYPIARGKDHPHGYCYGYNGPVLKLNNAKALREAIERLKVLFSGINLGSLVSSYASWPKEWQRSLPAPVRDFFESRPYANIEVQQEGFPTKRMKDAAIKENIVWD